jgi:mono/diheme cytochrome c family protein
MKMMRTFRSARTTACLASVLAAGTTGCVQQSPALASHANFASMQGAQQAQSSEDQILFGRALVLNHDCRGCHGGTSPADSDWLAGMKTPDQEFLIGPCALTTGAKPCFKTRPRNLTPDNATGMGRFSERQIFNALRYGLRPEDTPDVEITSFTPGMGNFPRRPKYLAPPMPWASWRYMSDQELWAIAAYLKRAVKPVSNRVADSEGPPDFWASAYTVDKIGPYPPPAFPAASEHVP